MTAQTPQQAGARGKGMTFDRHDALGYELQTMRDNLIRVSGECSQAYPFKMKLSDLAGKALLLIDGLRSELGNKACWENQHLDSQTVIRVYSRGHGVNYTESEFFNTFVTVYTGRMRKKPGFTLDRHDALGLELQTMRDNLVIIEVEIEKAYSSKLASLARKAWGVLDTLRGVLDDKVCAENPTVANASLLYLRVNRPDYMESEFSKAFATDCYGRSLCTRPKVAA